MKWRDWLWNNGEIQSRDEDEFNAAVKMNSNTMQGAYSCPILRHGKDRC